MNVVNAVSSPCIGVCRISSETQLCLGCRRSREEIRAWSKMSEPERQALIRELDARPSGIKRRGGRARNAAK